MVSGKYFSQKYVIKLTSNRFILLFQNYIINNFHMENYCKNFPVLDLFHINKSLAQKG